MCREGLGGAGCVGRRVSGWRGQVQEIPLTNIYWGVVHTKT